MRERSDSAARSAEFRSAWSGEIQTNWQKVQEVRATMIAKATKALTSFSKFSMHETRSRIWQRYCLVLPVIAFIILLSAGAVFFWFLDQFTSHIYREARIRGQPWSKISSDIFRGISSTIKLCEIRAVGLVKAVQSSARQFLLCWRDMEERLTRIHCTSLIALPSCIDSSNYWTLIQIACSPILLPSEGKNIPPVRVIHL